MLSSEHLSFFFASILSIAPLTFSDSSFFLFSFPPLASSTLYNFFPFLYHDLNTNSLHSFRISQLSLIFEKKLPFRPRC